MHVSLFVDEPPEQVYPDSTEHVELQPSLLLAFPSSQYVLIELYLLPSPHISTQVSFVEVEPPDHCQPDSIAQVELQPSPFIILPSSQ